MTTIAPQSTPSHAVTSLASYHSLYQRSIADPEGFWGDMARQELTWHHAFDKVSDNNWDNGLIT
jgi:acetyl-CoA synthetase